MCHITFQEKLNSYSVLSQWVIISWMKTIVKSFSLFLTNVFVLVTVSFFLNLNFLHKFDFADKNQSKLYHEIIIIAEPFSLSQKCFGVWCVFSRGFPSFPLNFVFGFYFVFWKLLLLLFWQHWSSSSGLPSCKQVLFSWPRHQAFFECCIKEKISNEYIY